ncbi:diacylglycerol kinase family protein [Nocardioides sp. CER19]|uniref:diacylglycerol/lipid kinase family protein n=1 Tax=Nocardioides sp. CER19 TaxID=3038538 RepID=UPI00244C5F73|nr:diacylglycerol kinase family protein [Nocardioides sp. CER19]MDH2413264.1 diacylglycerol kinase family protein [Nocardioides sp. CER19]
MRYLVVVSPAAGNTDDSKLTRALTVLRGSGAEVELVESGSPDELDTVLDRVDDRVLVVAGGDGSLHAVVQALHDRGKLASVTLGLVPLGTGNDFARSLDVPLAPEAAAHAIVEGTPCRLDLLVDDHDGVVVNSVHTGAGAAAARAADRWKARLGRAGYVVGALTTAVNPPTVRVRVVVDGRVVHDGRVLQVAVGNGAYVGGGTALTPDADPTDGAADVLIARPATGWAHVTYAAGLLVGRHHLHEDVDTFRGRVVEVTGERFWCSVDGELTGPHHARRWRVERSAYSLIR